MRIFALLILIGGMAVLVVIVWLGWLLSESKDDSSISSAVAWIQLVGVGGALMATFIAVVGAYYTFFTPFTPELTVGAYTWRVRPEGSPNPSVEVVLWLSATNNGARPGQIRDLMAVLSFPKGDWILTPMFFVDSPEYLSSLTRKSDSPVLPASEPFSPIALSGGAQISKAVLFMPFEGKADRQLLEPGVQRISFYAHYGDGTVSRIADRKIVFEAEMVEKWRHGTTIAGAQFERDRPAEEVLEEFGVPVRP